MLITRERRGDGSIYYSLPGGGVKPGESPHEALARELIEELGCTGTIGKQVGTCFYRHRSIEVATKYDVYAVTLGGEPTPNSDERIVGVELHCPSALPERMLKPLASLVSQCSAVTASERAVQTFSSQVLNDS